jgi:hypothetical protein
MIRVIRRSTISESARVTSLRVGALRNTFPIVDAKAYVHPGKYY